METLLGVRFNRLADGVLALPLSPNKRPDQVSIEDIAEMTAHAIEQPDRLVGHCIDPAPDSVTGREAVAILSELHTSR